MYYKSEVFAATAARYENENQDNMIVDNILSGIARSSCFSMHTYFSNTETRVFAVCDGAGGEADGAKASHQAVKTLSAQLQLLKEADENLPDVLDECNRAVIDSYKYGPVGATTVSGVLLKKNEITVFNLGDSPVWLYRDGKLTLLSQIQTQAEMENLQKSGNKSKDTENVITGYLGDRENAGSEQASITQHPIFPGDMLLLCSDGVEKGLTEKEILKILKKKKIHYAEELVEQAFRQATARNFSDDTTAIVVRIL